MSDMMKDDLNEEKEMREEEKEESEENAREEKEGEGSSNKSSRFSFVQKSISCLREHISRGSFVFFGVLFFIGAAFGFAAGTLASKSLSLGYWDYLISPEDVRAVNLNLVEKRLEAKVTEEAEAAAKQQQPASEGSPETPPPPPSDMPAPPEESLEQ